MMLSVSAPFHCALMRPAADAMAEALERVTLTPPRVPVIANVSADETSDPAEIRELLVQQVTGRVRWRECVLAMKARGVDTEVEVGAGKVLTGMLKRIDKDIAGIAVNTPADIEAFLKTV
jgi:[acyl-carrier-protein] S-malonyltransferase